MTCDHSPSSILRSSTSVGLMNSQPANLSDEPMPAEAVMTVATCIHCFALVVRLATYFDDDSLVGDDTSTGGDWSLLVPHRP